MLRYLVASLVFISTAYVLPAAAQSADYDMQCLILSDFYGSVAKDAAHKQAASIASVYYLGRVAARISNADLKAKYLAQASRLQGKNTGQPMNACFRQVRAQEQIMTSVRQDAARSLAKRVKR